MQGLRPLEAHQDENSGAVLRSNFKGGLGFGDTGRSAGFGAKGTPHGNAPSARKALGNITNHGFQGVALPGKTPVNTVRKALGNITNAGVAGADARPAPMGAVACKAWDVEQRIDELSAGGVEKLAGKGWKDLEREREAQADAEILQRATALAAYGKRALPNYFPAWVRQTQRSACTS